ncbi:COX15/CtaA family protein [Lipingzhangella sp. LS1_29]|uniref:COX15/CtaA family protein n=1 Tax=Lipingzhangella rawalii TaxID=2055835 RepID=A0ABU2H0B6_9ACTN|nr:COX15/CtaA family protein [Lipingzhangella rawalii]MDS1268758.1 COX15/CtaA family protein [Lipingzhangella rawalii]
MLNSSWHGAELAATGAHVLGVPFWAWQILLSGIGVLTLAALARTAWHPTPSALRWWALGNVVVNAGIAVTGATVRVTQSGLGCPEWPRCTPDSFVPSGGEYHPVLNEAIEFGNRMLTFLVLAVGLIVLLAVWRLHHQHHQHREHPRPDLLLLAVITPLGVLGQGVVGGISVLTELHPAAVGSHFLLSMVILVVAVALYVRCQEPGGELQRTVSPLAHRLAVLVTGLGFVVLAAGVVTTGTGPHGGDLDAPRWPLDLAAVTQTHSSLAWVLLAATGLLLATLLYTRSGRQPRVLAVLLLTILVGQGALGYIQYSLALPEGLVVLHVLGAVVCWVTILRLYFSATRRAELTQPSPEGAREAAPAPGR